jgi:hypothetical protein
MPGPPRHRDPRGLLPHFVADPADDPEAESVEARVGAVELDRLPGEFGAQGVEHRAAFRQDASARPEHVNTVPAAVEPEHVIDARRESTKRRLGVDPAGEGVAQQSATHSLIL